MKKILLVAAVIIFPIFVFGQLHGDGLTPQSGFYGIMDAPKSLGPGVVYISGDIVNGDINTMVAYVLTINPGTTLKINTDANIIIYYGLIIASGTPTSPISFRPFDTNPTWGRLYMVNADAGSVLVHCAFEGGRANGEEVNGGVIYATNTTLSITDCHFIDNSALAGRGGAIFVAGSSNVQITNCVFCNNEAFRGGAIFSHQYPQPCSLVVDRCRIYSNTAFQGGGIFIMQNAYNTTIKNTLIYNNEATSFNGGGGIWGDANYADQAHNIINCVIANNTPNGVDLFRGISTIFQNSSIWGSDVSVYYESSEAYSTDNFMNCAIQNIIDVSGEIDISNFNNCLKLNSSNTEPDGPNFTDPLNSDYSIAFNSPCRDNGKATGTPAPPETDYLGNGRIGPYDIGAYEVQYSSWLGTTDNLWTTATNWDKSVDPGTGTGDVVIPSGYTNQPLITGTAPFECLSLSINDGSVVNVDAGAALTVTGNLFNNGNLIIESLGTIGLNNSGSLIVGSTSGTGLVTYNRYLRPDNINGDRHFFSSPVGGQGVSAFITANPNKINLGGDGYQIWEWDEEELTANWQIVLSTVSFESGRGYCVNQAVGSDGLLKFTGAVINSATVISTSPYANYNDNPRSTRADYGDPAYTSDQNIWAQGRSWIDYGGGGWNLMGNPFTSAMNAATFVSVNTGKFDPNYQALYVYDGNSVTPQYLYAAAATPVPAYNNGGWFSDNIQVGQGFFVLALYNNIDFNFTPAMQVHNTGLTLLKSGKAESNSWPGLQLKVSYGDTERATTIIYNSEMTIGCDPGYDVGQLSAGSYVEIYTALVLKDNSVNFARQALPLIDNEKNIIPVGIDTEKGGEVTFSAAVVPLEDKKFWLEDRLTGIYTDLTTKSYIVNLPENTYGTGRFFIIASKNTPTGVEKPLAEHTDVRIWTSYDKVIIQGGVSDRAICEVFNVDGRKILDVRLTGGELNTFNLPSGSKGVFIVRVVDGVNIATRKVALL